MGGWGKRIFKSTLMLKKGHFLHSHGDRPACSAPPRTRACGKGDGHPLGVQKLTPFPTKTGFRGSPGEDTGFEGHVEVPPHRDLYLGSGSRMGWDLLFLSPCPNPGRVQLHTQGFASPPLGQPRLGSLYSVTARHQT